MAHKLKFGLGGWPGCETLKNKNKKICLKKQVLLLWKIDSMITTLVIES